MVLRLVVSVKQSVLILTITHLPGSNSKFTAIIRKACSPDTSQGEPTEDKISMKITQNANKMRQHLGRIRVAFAFMLSHDNNGDSNQGDL